MDNNNRYYDNMNDFMYYDDDMNNDVYSSRYNVEDRRFLIQDTIEDMTEGMTDIFMTQ